MNASTAELGLQPGNVRLGAREIVSTSTHLKMGTPWTSPILRWAGSKRKLLSSLIARVPHSFNRYIEPFAGSACLFFALRPDSAILGDINADLMATYGMLCKHPRIVARSVRSLKHTRSEYYRVRATYHKEKDPLQRAIYFIYLNRYSFNGVYRTNRRGEFNVPFGTNTGGIPDSVDFYRCSLALRRASLLTSDFTRTIANAERGDFVYLDPPYSSCNRPRYGEYGYGSFQPLQLAELVSALDALDRRGAKFLVSYASSRAARRAFSRFQVESISVRRHVAGFAKHRHDVRELLVSNR